MLIGILSDTHDELERTRRAVALLRESGAELLVHCGDLMSPEIVVACAELPLYFVFGNHDCDVVPQLEAAAELSGAICLRWGGEFQVAGKRVAVTHGHLTMDLRPLLEAEPDYLLSGHTHASHDFFDGSTRRINPGALSRTDGYSVALLDVVSGALNLLPVNE